MDDLADVFEVKSQTVEPVHDAGGQLLECTLDLLPDRRDLAAEFLICIPQVLESGDQYSDDRNNSDHGCGYASDSRAKLCKYGFTACNDLRHFGNELHQPADRGDRFADADKQRSECRRYQCNF
ncbi:MAG: hypothetical protein BWY83_03409 [bacterium ADurb.Bin478]|nr:MAG: hypothetical protein BWY83_03409 [bacterium ADurb.Bin478]